MNEHKIVNGVAIDLTAEEIAEISLTRSAYVLPTTPSTPTKEELMAQLAALSAQIQALE